MTHRINCILADEMGLGKTLQAVSYICCRYQLEDFGVGLSFRQNPCLVVAPLSTCHNWLAEFSKWAPQLNVVFYSGDAASREIIENHELFLPFSRGLPRIHVLVTTYENCLSNPPFLRRIKWMAIIVDEGQRLKNNESKLFYTLSQIDDAHRILLTGTPLQNDIYELHNLLLFLDPAKFDSDNYREKFSSENWTDIKNIEDLHRRIRPHLLRRVKSDVLSDLPPKKEVIVPTLQTSLQRHLSREIIKGDLKILQKGKRTSNVLRNTLIQLRKCINHPYLFPNIEPEDE
jgi:SNF2 family DNA or RNA helicase